jgi:hypothetical protein
MPGCWPTKRWCCSLAGAQLTFEETRAIALATVSVDDALIDALYRQSDGWAAGLTLMLERVRRNAIALGHLEAETRKRCSATLPERYWIALHPKIDKS